MPTAYDERPIPELAPLDLALTHARGKAAGAAPTGDLVIAADTVVDLDGRALGKPDDTAEAVAMLHALSGRWHAVHTAFSLRNDRTAASYTEAVSTRVRFAELSDEAIRNYAATGDGLDKAGAYGIQGFAATLIERIEGDYFTVVGFPLSAFAHALPHVGYVLNPARTEVLVR